MRTEMLTLILGMAAVTYLTRNGSLALLRFTGLPSWFERWFRYMPVGVLTALIVPSILLPQGQLDITLQNDYLIAGIVAALVAYKRCGAAVTMAAGMVVMLALRF